MGRLKNLVHDLQARHAEENRPQQAEIRFRWGRLFMHDPRAVTCVHGVDVSTFCSTCEKLAERYPPPAHTTGGLPGPEPFTLPGTPDKRRHCVELKCVSSNLWRASCTCGVHCNYDKWDDAVSFRNNHLLGAHGGAAAPVTGADALLLRLWTKAVGTPGYDKAEWQELNAQFLGLQQRSEKTETAAIRKAKVQLLPPRLREVHPQTLGEVWQQIALGEISIEQAVKMSGFRETPEKYAAWFKKEFGVELGRTPQIGDKALEARETARLEWESKQTTTRPAEREDGHYILDEDLVGGDVE